MITSVSIDWQSIIYRGIESEELDYKAAQNWKLLSRAGKSKFVRHCMALANTKGGYIVVGVGEDRAGRPTLYTGLTEEESKSFDPTDVGNFLNHFADPAVDFRIERPIVDGKRFAIFVVRRFSSLPHVCSHGCNSELQQGVFYIRTTDAASRPAFRASEVHAVVQRALRNQRAQLGRMLRGILYEERKGVTADAQTLFSQQLRDSEHVVSRPRTELSQGGAVLCEIVASPSEFVEERFSLSHIKRALEESVSTLADVPFPLVGGAEESYFTNVAFRSYPHKGAQFWQCFQSGLFYHLRRMEAVSYVEVQKRVTEAVYFFGIFYSTLGCEEEILCIRVRLNPTDGLVLAAPTDPDEGYGRCRIPSIDVGIERTVGDLMSGAVQHSSKLVRKICERFNVADEKLAGLEGGIRDFLQSRDGTTRE